MMDPAYFVGRKEILDWVNEHLQTNLSKIEQTANGAIACQLLDVIHPGAVPMSKINWDAKNDYEFVSNYKVLQSSFDRLGIDRYIDVPKLIRAKYQDNLEFMQWFKGYFDQNTPSESYDAIGQRAKGKGGARYHLNAASGGARARAPAPAAGKGVPTRQPLADKKVAAPSAAKRASRASPADAGGGASTKEGDLMAEIQEQANMIQSLQEEREFYFEKLREIEILVQANVDDGNDSPLIQSIFKILYATNEEFEARRGNEPERELHEDGELDPSENMGAPDEQDTF